MAAPLSTYRVQFGSGFGFVEAQRQVDYLSRLGVGAIYASPIFACRRGSLHGYDVTEPTRLNEALGSREDFRELIEASQVAGLGWVQDIVPNHMAYGWENPRVAAVWEQGKASRYAEDLDIDWDGPCADLRGRVLAPFLGEGYGQALAEGLLKVVYEQGRLWVRYHAHRFPLRLSSYATLLGGADASVGGRMGGNAAVRERLTAALELLARAAPAREHAAEAAAGNEALGAAREVVWELYQRDENVRTYVDERVAAYGGGQEAADRLDQVLGEQFYSLSYWRRAQQEINYRRFFAINGLIGVRVEREEVYRLTHGLVLELCRAGVFSGLRVDHIDGLYRPEAYLRRLRRDVGDVTVVVEKILGRGERLCASWPVEGSTGYDFLNVVNGLFCAEGSGEALSQVYGDFAGSVRDFSQAAAGKRFFLEVQMAGEVEELARRLKRLGGCTRDGRDVSLGEIREALTAIAVHLPVYRTYLEGQAYRAEDLEQLSRATEKAAAEQPGLARALRWVSRCLGLANWEGFDAAARAGLVGAAMRFQQVTGPAAAKGVEDTAFYVYNRLVSLNEVGGDPGEAGVSVERFHEFCRARAVQEPHGLNASSTHDTKRGEDARARLNVLSEMPAAWGQRVRVWRRMNRALKRQVAGEEAPDANDEYLLYQTLVSVYPFGPAARQGRVEAAKDAADDDPTLVERVKAYMVKATREAKRHTSWSEVNKEYEQACEAFVEGLLDAGRSGHFLSDFEEFARNIAHFGVCNSLSATLIKLTAPGLPDIYQGSELWDLSLVDPDNRRAVDYDRRRRMLAELEAMTQGGCLPEAAAELLANEGDGRSKLWVIYRGLQTRQQYRRLFERGDYVPVRVEGKGARCVVAFARCMEGSNGETGPAETTDRPVQWAVTVAVRCTRDLVGKERWPMGRQVWQDTTLVLPTDAPRRWREVLAGQVLEGRRLGVGKVLEWFPVALLLC